MLGHAVKNSHRRLLANGVFAVALALSASVFAGCSAQSEGRDVPMAQASVSGHVEPSGPDESALAQAKGMTAAKARALLESKGWTVKTTGTKDRKIKKADEQHWQVTAVKRGKQDSVTLTAGKLTHKTAKLPFKTKKVKVDYEPTTYKHVVQKGVTGKMRITYLDGIKIRSKVTKPVTKIIEVGTQGWECLYDPTFNHDWHDDVICERGNEARRPYLRGWDSFVTEDEIMRSAREYEAKLNR